MQASSLVLVVAATCMGALGAMLIKKAVNKSALTQVIYNKNFISGVMLYGLSFVFYLLPLRREPLSVIYPLVSTSYLWSTFFFVKFLGEKMNALKWTGLAGIIFGVILIGLGA